MVSTRTDAIESGLSPATPHTNKLLFLPAVFTATLALITFAPSVSTSNVLKLSVWMAAVALVCMQIGVIAVRRRSAFVPSIRVELRAQHYVQAIVQLSLYVYWGYYWREVYDHAWLIVAQLLFAYSFDMLLSWSRREHYTLGFGVFPIVFSTNLFLWFKDDWFYLQFIVIAVGILGKEFVKWQRDGRRVHIFNPSAFTLAVFSVVLIATDASDMTWAQQIASTLTLAPHYYVFMFTIGLVVMYFFSITPITFAAAATLFALSAIYYALNDVPYFLDSEIPAAVFLGMHLLVTDPSTSPRSLQGKIIFGVLYGAGVFTLYGLLNAIGAPTFYDKLMCVPLLNLAVQRIDRLSQWLGHKTTASITPMPIPNLAIMVGWIVFFIVMTSIGKTDGKQVGDSLPFWEQACSLQKPRACERLIKLELTYCGDNSAWACNELALHYSQGKVVPADSAKSTSLFSKACELRFAPACVNLLEPDAHLRADPKTLDLRLLLREHGRNLMDMSELDLRARACDHGWAFACGGKEQP